jgi:citrate synthase
MKKPEALYLSAREASAELAISPATLYAYVSRGLIRSEPSADSRSHRYRAEDVRGLKERRVPTPEPRGFAVSMPFGSGFGIDHHGSRRDLSRRQLRRTGGNNTLEHAATLLWDVTTVDLFAPDNCPLVSDEMRAIAEAARRARRSMAIAVLALASRRSARLTRDDGRAMVGSASAAVV